MPDPPAASVPARLQDGDLRAVVFDWDGTLVDSAAVSFRCYVQIFESFGLRFDHSDFARTYSPDWTRTYQALALPRERWAEADRLWLEFYAREQSALIPGARETLAGLAPEAGLPFAVARDNFYRAARYGLNATLRWRNSGGETEVSVRSLIIDELLPIARRGLESRGIPGPEIDEYLGVVAARAESAQNGAAWQRGWVARNGPDLHGLTRAYRSLQESGEPVHLWPL